MHQLLSQVDFARFHGTNVDTDFLEIPAKVFEWILWTPSVLQRLSCHYSQLSPRYMKTWRADTAEAGTVDALEIPKVMPHELIIALLDSRNVNLTLSVMGPLFLSTFDLKVHSRTDRDLSAEELALLYGKLRRDITGLAGDELESYGYSVNRSLMGNYDAGYYTYIL